MKQIPVLNIITRMIIGGAQETPMLTADLIDKSQWAMDILSGPQTGPEGSLIEETRSRGISLKIEPMLVREINPLKDIIALFRLIRFIKKGKYKIVHTHSSKAGILGRWAAWLAGTPVIIHTVHGWGHNSRQHPLIRAFYILLEKLTLPITDRLIAVSPLDIQKGLSDGIGKQNDFVVIRSGIELERFGHPKISRDKTRSSLGIPPHAFVIGSVTRLSPQKAPLDFIEAVGIIAKKNPNAWFVIVGDGPLRQDVERLANKLDLKDRLILTGLRRDIPELMAAFDIFVLSSLWEGLPRVLPQAMATGLPIVATNIDGNAEAVIDRLNGLLTPPSDPSALAQAIIEIMNDPEMADRMGAAGMKCSHEFGAQKMTDEIEMLYKELTS
ncbi:Glycosyltransferase family 4 protein [Candidatus Magnetomoraceae bacterium gMMP-15]